MTAIPAGAGPAVLPSRAVLASVLVLAGAACASPFGERPPAVRTPPGADQAGPREGRSPAPSSDDEQTVVGTVGPDGRLDADTLAGSPSDTARAERETVVIGKVRSPATSVAREPEPAPVVPAGEGPVLAARYRVQVFASHDEASASQVARRLEARVPGEPVEVEWEEPWYKVRIGDFRDRNEADRLRSLLVEMGFADAWTVEAPVRGL